ncbi:helix-hairpin-helix domain-containing protein [Fructobacillus ficulneus]|uniref:ComEA protein n=1 Tax=Fructobacillus ficulneus TaxID=157463 RepID=A0A0K8MGP7_9LACO|nr:helix-hairpin-helix domain-containing protein [Fructobacillus ficulneus]GAO99710.1 ComEA protein [Fructobacillus ficulneus]
MMTKINWPAIKDWSFRHWRYLVIGLLVILALLALVVRLFHHSASPPTNQVEMTGSIPAGTTPVKSGPPANTGASQAKPNEPILVDVKGAVNKPGVVKLPPGSRVQDAVHQAGGLTTEADQRVLNLAQVLTDGQVLYVLKEGEQAPVGVVGAGSGGGSGGSSVGQAKVNLNTATAKDLEALDGIGPKKAEQIVAFREKQGPFQSVDGLKEVGGIGPKRFDQLKDQVTV